MHAGGLGEWSTDTCNVAENNDTFVVCECTQFANFAVRVVSCVACVCACVHACVSVCQGVIS